MFWSLNLLVKLNTFSTSTPICCCSWNAYAQRGILTCHNGLTVRILRFKLTLAAPEFATSTKSADKLSAAFTARCAAASAIKIGSGTSLWYKIYDCGIETHISVHGVHRLPNVPLCRRNAAFSKVCCRMRSCSILGTTPLISASCVKRDA